MEKHFHLFAKGASSIRRDDALKVMQSIGQDQSRKEFNEGLNLTGFTSQDKLTFDETKLLAQVIWNDASLESLLIESFKRLDKNGTGTIDEQKLKSILMNSGERLDESEFRSMMSLAEVSHDGQVNYSSKYLNCNLASIKK